MKGKIELRRMKHEGLTRQKEAGLGHDNLEPGRILLEEKIRVEERRLRGVLVKYLGCDEI